MIHAFAIEPELVARTWGERRMFRFIRESMGLGTPRVLLELPNFAEWRSRVEREARNHDLSDGERNRLGILLGIMHGAYSKARLGFAYDTKRSWLQNAMSEYQRHSFAAIITEHHPERPPYVRAADDLGTTSNHDPCWDFSRAAVSARTAADLAGCVAPMLLNSSSVRFVDPYFHPHHRRFNDVLEEMLHHVARRRSGFPEYIEVHCGHHPQRGNQVDQRLQRFNEDSRRWLPHRTPEGIRIDFFRWRQRPSGEKFHNRYVLTDIGGVQFGTGLDRGYPHSDESDDVNLLSAEQYYTRWHQFDCNRQPTTFELVDRPDSIVGTRNWGRQ